MTGRTTRQDAGRVAPLPACGDVFLDACAPEKGMRVTWHQEVGLVVVSLWRGNTCPSTMRLAPQDVPRLISALAGGLAAAYPDAASDRAS
jgi:hypothetical protein